MLISWQLLKEFIDFAEDVTPEQAAERLTLSGTEIESIERPAGKLSGVVAARVQILERHESDDKLLVAHLDTGSGKYHKCVTSAHNIKQGDLVLYAGEGAVLPDGNVLGVRDFKGVKSAGMMLSAGELGLPDVDDNTGLLILPDDAVPGTDARTLYHIGDVILDVSITPNRGDLLSLLGMARELKGLFNKSNLITPWWLRPLKHVNDWSESFGNINLPDKGCIAYRLGLATGAEIKKSPLTVRIDLQHLGMRPINNAVDVTNYIMLALGQPLHAFDLNTLPAREITVRAANNGEKMTTLDNKERILNEQDMLITSGGEAIAIAGVMGGLQTGINDNTKTIVIESACFSPVRVGYTSRRLGIASEAAFRFSRTVDPVLSSRALSAALTLLSHWCGAEVGYKVLSAENEHKEPEAIKLTRAKLNKYLNWADLDESRKILEGFGIKYLSGNKDELEFMPPSFRPDISIEEDLIEEIGRYRGYNDAPAKLPGELPRRAELGSEMSLALYTRNFMMARGYTEVVTYSFLPEKFYEFLRLDESDIRAKPLVLANPISRDQMAMRTTLIPGLLTGLKNSILSGWREPVRIFEQGKIFLRDNNNSHIEFNKLAGLLFNGVDARDIYKQPEDFYSLKADVTALIEGRGFNNIIFEADSESFAHSGQTASVSIIINNNKIKLGFIARLKPSLEQELDINNNIYIFELDLTPLENIKRPELKPASLYPASTRDISLLVNKSKSHADIEHDIRESVSAAAEAKNLDLNILESLRLFDVYQGKGIPEGFVSLAYSLAYRLNDRTLKDDEVESLHNAVRESLSLKGYTMR
ncbi:MAG: phenylalanine--tRNA ligase subunit beta [Synergistaceae bacterium]|nr:phenylalanine--tRNA ligase subunit beta [Synergistaceae bacterium]